MSWRGNCEGDPLSPPVGEAAQGGNPAMLHGASPDEAVSTRGPIVI